MPGAVLRQNRIDSLAGQGHISGYFYDLPRTGGHARPHEGPDDQEFKIDNFLRHGYLFAGFLVQ